VPPVAVRPGGYKVCGVRAELLLPAGRGSWLADDLPGTGSKPDWSQSDCNGRPDFTAVTQQIVLPVSALFLSSVLANARPFSPSASYLKRPQVTKGPCSWLGPTSSGTFTPATLRGPAAKGPSMAHCGSRGIHAARPTPRHLRSACTQVAICGVWAIARLEATATATAGARARAKAGARAAGAEAGSSVLPCCSPAGRLQGLWRPRRVASARRAWELACRRSAGNRQQTRLESVRLQWAA